MTLTTLDHGTTGVLLGYAFLTIPMFAGLLHGRAALSKYFLAPVVAIPLCFVAALIAALLRWAWTKTTHIPVSGGVQAASSAAFLMGVGFLTGKLACRQLGDAGHKRGTLIVEGAYALRASRALKRRHGDDLLTLAGMALFAEDETKHFKMIGTTGTGKSTAIRELLAGALKRGDRAVIADPDAGYLNRFYDEARGDVILNPFDPRSRKWDVYGEIQNAYDVDQLARSLIPEGANPSASEWRGYARTFFAAVAKQTRESGITDIAELFRLLTSAPVEELRILVEGTPAQPFLSEANARMFGSIRSVTTAAIAALEYIQEQQAPLLSVREWVRSGRGALFIPYQADQIAALKSVIATWMRLAIFQTMSQGERDHRLWFMVDELDALGQIDGLKDALARLRKFGGRCVLGFQSLAQVSGTYGSEDAQTIVENCTNTLILRCSASEGGGTARFASKLIGEREVIRQTTSHSRSGASVFSKHSPRRSINTSEQHITEAAVMPSEIEQLPDLTGYLKIASRPEWLTVRLRPP